VKSFDLKKEYDRDDQRGIMVVQLAGTYQLGTKKENASYLKKLVDSPHTTTISQAALETLAIIAYKQPITRAEIEEIRGVKTERPLHTLMAKALIKEVGRAEGTGRAYLYGTTKEFLDYFGLKSIEELPQLPERAEAEFIQEEADLFFEKFQETINS
jgi:segregation and condensation protein B